MNIIKLNSSKTKTNKWNKNKCIVVNLKVYKNLIETKELKIQVLESFYFDKDVANMASKELRRINKTIKQMRA